MKGFVNQSESEVVRCGRKTLSPSLSVKFFFQTISQFGHVYPEAYRLEPGNIKKPTVNDDFKLKE